MKDASNLDATRLEVSTTILNKCWVKKDKPRKLPKWGIHDNNNLMLLIIWYSSLLEDVRLRHLQLNTRTY